MKCFLTDVTMKSLKIALQSGMMELLCSYSTWEAEPGLLTRCFDSIDFTFIAIPSPFFQREENNEGQAEVREEDRKEGSSRMKAEREQKYRLKTGHWWLLRCDSVPQKG